MTDDANKPLNPQVDTPHKIALHYINPLVNHNDYDELRLVIRNLTNDIEAYAAQQAAAVYNERNHCVVGLALLARDLGFKTGLARHPEDEEWDDEWRNIVFIELPTGQVSWHVHDSDMKDLYSFSSEPYKWDGHTTNEKYRRLLDYTPTSLLEEINALRQQNAMLVKRLQGVVVPESEGKHD